MTTRITQVNGQTGKVTTLRVEGSLRLADAELLEATYFELREQHAGTIAIDLTGTNFLDSDSASVLCRLKDNGAELVGLHYFIQRIIEAAKNSSQR
jgi:anti-anti-sigma regulatory factor